MPDPVCPGPSTSAYSLYGLVWYSRPKYRARSLRVYWGGWRRKDRGHHDGCWLFGRYGSCHTDWRRLLGYLCLLGGIFWSGWLLGNLDAYVGIHLTGLCQHALSRLQSGFVQLTQCCFGYERLQPVQAFLVCRNRKPRTLIDRTVAFHYLCHR